MTFEFSQPAQKAIKISAFTAGATFALVEGTRRAVNWYREKHGLEPLEEDRDLSGAKVGAGMTITGVVFQSPSSPYVTGIGAGLTAQSVTDFLRSIRPPPEVVRAITADSEAAQETTEPPEPGMETYHVPVWPWTLRYRKIADILQGIMNQDVVVDGKKIPAARWHPEVVGYARNLVSSYNIDAKDPLQVSQAVFDHFSTRYTYALDPRRADSDYFVRPHLFLRPADRKGYGLTGDCDDIALAVGAVLLAVGVPAVLVCFKQRSDQDYYNHVIACAALPEDEYAGAVPPGPEYRATLPSGQRAVLIPFELTTKDKQWLRMPRYVKRGIVHFDNSF